MNQNQQMRRQDETVVNQRIEANRNAGYHKTIVGGLEFLVFPTVFSPEFNASTHWAAKIFPFPKNHESMLEIGTGCGALSIHAALHGCQNVTAPDVNPISVECAKENARIHNVDIECVTSNIFDQLDTQKFDMIFWNFPSNYPEEEESIKDFDFCAQGYYDPGYELMERYLAEARNYIRPHGRIYMTFPRDMGNIRRFNELTEKCAVTAIQVKTTDCSSMGDTRMRISLYQLVPNENGPII